MKLRNIILLSAFALVAGLAYWYNKQVQIMENMAYSLIGFSVQSGSATQATLDITIRMQSNSTLQAEIMSAMLQVYVSGMLIGTVQPIQPFIIPAMGYSDAQLSVSFNPSQIATDALSLLTSIGNLGALPVSVIGQVTIKSAFLTLPVPFTYNSTVSSLTS